jgi:hypothetical protein
MEYNTILGYQYLTEQEAINATNLCNNYYGVPKSPDDITTSITTYYFSYGNPSFYYIIWFDLLTPVLGEPTTFDVIITPPSGTTINV